MKIHDCHEITFVKTPKGFPSTISIASQIWNIKYSDNLTSKENLLGVTLPQDRTIIIDSKQCEDNIRDTLTHELLHACLAVNATHNLDFESEERVVRSITVVLSSLLRDNPPWWLYKK